MRRRAFCAGAAFSPPPRRAGADDRLFPAGIDAVEHERANLPFVFYEGHFPAGGVALHGGIHRHFADDGIEAI